MIRWILRFLGLWSRRSEEKYVEKTCVEFAKELETLAQDYTAHRESLAIKDSWKPVYRKILTIHIPKWHKLYSVRREFVEKYQQLDAVIGTMNEQFVAAEIQRCDDLLSDIDGKSLDMQQREAVVTGEDRNLVIAGAGSGKTLTIVGKVKYLCECKGINPDDILLIAFTNKAADEMTARLNAIGIPVKAKTFHKLGMDIIASRTQRMPDVLQDGKFEAFVRDFFNNQMVKNYALVSALLEYFAYYFYVPTQTEKFGSMGEVYQHEKGPVLETIRGKYWKSRDPLTTMAGEVVKSREELCIANFLFLNSVNYQYETKYPHVAPDAHHGSYHPDFYLPDYDIYIEHFGIDKDGRTPQYSPNEEKKYLSGIEWKRRIHQDHKTTLVETYSYYASEGRLLDELKEKLHRHGVIFEERDAMHPSGTAGSI